MTKWDRDFEAPSSKIKSHTSKKEESGSVAMQTISMEHINENYKDKLQVFTDGSKDIDKHMDWAAFEVPSLDLKVGIKCNPNLSVFTTELIAIEYAITTK